jgi:ABC-type uncharacterized transport system auxiliary subunit
MKYAIVLLAMAMLVACDDKPPQRTVFDPQVKALEKARAVDGQVREAGERRADEVRKIDSD